MPLENVQVSSSDFWISAIAALLIDLILLRLLTWKISPPRFRELRWSLVVVAAFLWSLFAVLLVAVFWDAYYRYFYPGWFRSGGVLVFVPLCFGTLAFVFHWVAIRTPGNPILMFCLLGGAESLAEHVWGIYGFRILDVPLLRSASPVSVLAFSFPEYILYWCVVIGIAALTQNAWRHLTQLRQRPAV